jgi:hypothetical protein
LKDDDKREIYDHVIGIYFFMKKCDNIRIQYAFTFCVYIGLLTLR